MEPRPLLPRYLLRLLRLAADAEDLTNGTLARLYGRPPTTVETYFKRLFGLTGIHDRGTLVLRAVLLRWIPTPTVRWCPPRPMSSNVPIAGLVCSYDFLYDAMVGLAHVPAWALRTWPFRVLIYIRRSERTWQVTVGSAEWPL